MAEQRTAIPAGSERTPQILGVDAGGTMTDTIFVDHRGQFTIGKALSTPADESQGLARSARDALGYWDLQLDRVVPSLRAECIPARACSTACWNVRAASTIAARSSATIVRTGNFGRWST